MVRLRVDEFSGYSHFACFCHRNRSDLGIFVFVVGCRQHPEWSCVCLVADDDSWLVADSDHRYGYGITVLVLWQETTQCHLTKKDRIGRSEAERQSYQVLNPPPLKLWRDKRARRRLTRVFIPEVPLRFAFQPGCPKPARVLGSKGRTRYGSARLPACP